MKRSDLEALALKEVRLAAHEDRAPREIVAIGFKFTWSVGTVWRVLPNRALENDRFRVDPSDLYAVLNDVRAEYGIEKTDAVESCHLWHSHNVHEKPSSLDIQNFPGHLFKSGFVYHTPTRTSRAYDSNGEISPLAPLHPRTTRSYDHGTCQET